MKRTLAILLLLAFLFNVGGHYIFFWGLHHQANQKLTQRLDADEYTADETIELKFPISLPYPLQNNGFERVNGKFEHRGHLYTLVKQKLENDTIYIVCIADVKGKQILDSMREYASKTAEVPANSKTSGFFSKLLHDFEKIESAQLESTTGWTMNISSVEIPLRFSNLQLQLDAPPPRV